MSVVQLGKLAQIRTGYPFRGRVDRAGTANCRLVQMGDVQAVAGVVPDVQTHVFLPNGAGKHELHFGDVLFIARGNRNEAATFAGAEDNTVATPHFGNKKTFGKSASHSRENQRNPPTTTIQKSEPSTSAAGLMGFFIQRSSVRTSVRRHA